MILNLLDDNLFNNLSDSSLRDVDYSCGSCGYELNLNSCNRNTSMIVGSKSYGKSIKRGIISFYSIDETRFTQIDQLRCKPYFSSIRSWGMFQTRTKLVCRKCGNYIGSAYQPGLRVPSSFNSCKEQESPRSACSSSPSTSISSGWDGMSGVAMYVIKIRALQPSSYHRPNTVNMIE